MNNELNDCLENDLENLRKELRLRRNSKFLKRIEKVCGTLPIGWQPKILDVNKEQVVLKFEFKKQNKATPMLVVNVFKTTNNSLLSVVDKNTNKVSAQITANNLGDVITIIGVAFAFASHGISIKGE